MIRSGIAVDIEGMNILNTSALYHTEPVSTIHIIFRHVRFQDPIVFVVTRFFRSNVFVDV